MSDGGVERTLRVLDEIAAERGRQFAKWGDQSDCGDADPVILARLTDPDEGHYWRAPGAVARRLSEEYEIPTGERGKQICQREAARHGRTHAGIVIEEIAELIDAVAYAHAEGDVTKMRTEAVQAAATLVRWIEAMDRRGVKAAPRRMEGRD
jgi:hypothetical protein